MGNKPKVIFFDIDGTLTKNNVNGWIKVSHHLGGDEMVQSHFENFMKWRNKELTTELFLKATCTMWATVDHHFPTVMEKIQPEIREEAHEMIESLKEQGVKVVLVSSAYKPYVEKVGIRFNIEEYFSNGDIGLDEYKRIKSIENFVGEETQLKQDQVRSYLEENRISTEEAWFVGNDKNDLLAIELVGRGFIIGDIALEESAKITRIESLLEVGEAIRFNHELDNNIF